MSYDIAYELNLKRNDTNELIYTTEADSDFCYGYRGWGWDKGGRKG